MKKIFQARQGDVFIQRLPDNAKIPVKAKPVPNDNGRTILAYGEVTGHAHALPGKAKLFRMEDTGSGAPNLTSYLEIEGLPCTLKHEEHAPIELPKGKYKVVIQREYSPEAIRAVAD